MISNPILRKITFLHFKGINSISHLHWLRCPKPLLSSRFVRSSRKLKIVHLPFLFVLVGSGLCATSFLKIL